MISVYAPQLRLPPWLFVNDLQNTLDSLSVDDFLGDFNVRGEKLMICGEKLEDPHGLGNYNGAREQLLSIT